jgi:hypothetical protein
LSGEFHGSGCTLEHAFAIADGQRIPNRNVDWNQSRNKETS